jgi:hypothetical protein
VTPAKSKREDKLPLERALRALEDVNQSLKKFPGRMANNDAFVAECKRSAQKQETPQTRDSVGNIMDRTLDFQFSGNQPN